MTAEKIYNVADDEHVATRVVYANSSNKIYYSETTQNADTLVPATDCLELFIKGVIAKKGTTFYAAKSCTEAGVIDFGFTA